jgi:hypothetical protein
MSVQNAVPYYALLARFAAAKAMKTEERLRYVLEGGSPLRASERFVDDLAGDFALSVRQLETQYASGDRVGQAVNGEASLPGRAPAVHRPRTAVSRKIARAVFGKDGEGGIDVLDDAELSTDYVGFELSPLRTSGGAHFVPAEQTAFPENKLPRAGNSVRVDLLSRTKDGFPVVQEVKVAADSDPPVALLQALAYTAALCPPMQYERVRNHYPTLMPSAAPKFDVQLIIAGTIPSPRSTRRPLWHVMPDLIRRLTARNEISGRIGTISGVRLSPEWPEQRGRISATRIDWMTPD